MRIEVIALTIAAFLAPAAFAQSDLTSRVFTLNSADTPQDMQEILNAVRTELEIQQATLDGDVKTITLQATAANIALAAWLIQSLEAPVLQPGQSLQVDRNPGPAGPADRLEVFHLAQVKSVQTENLMQGYQELVNLIRTLPEITKVFPRAGNFSIAVRGSEDRLALAEWLLQQVDLPVAPPGQPRPEQKFHSALNNAPEARVLYYAHNATVPQCYPIVNAVRTIPELTRVFPVMGKGALALAGPADRVALAEWLFGQLDQAAPATAFQASATYDGGGLGVSQVFFLPGSVSEQSFGAMVANVKAIGPGLKAFPSIPIRAVAVSGTPAQLTQAAGILKNAGNP